MGVDEEFERAMDDTFAKIQRLTLERAEASQESASTADPTCDLGDGPRGSLENPEVCESCQ